ncbi:synaptopodin-2 isoform X2 [Melopsittacus undulatus]|uniref:synaptopodin-2 isoform X2 n=1 Tax=Melopsittacus undulatus TaxID=13146 RepID=UPI00146DE89C|nr:synaptopodin-2 isoform X2 [Melopsittacus undulatus]
MLPNCTRKMGTGDYLCIAMSGGAPWGFRLQGGKEQKQPLQIAKVRSKSKAAKAGLCEGDEVVSINGKPCGDLTYAEVIVLMESLTDVLQMLIKRSFSGINEALSAGRENGKDESINKEDYRESTTMQINTAKEIPHGDLCITEIHRESHQGAGERNIHFSATKQEITQSQRITPKVIGTSKVLVTDETALRGNTEERRPGTMVELQLSLSNEKHKSTHDPAVTLLGAEKCTLSGREPSVQQDGTSPVITIPLGMKEGNIQWSSKVVQFSNGKEIKRIQGTAPSLPRVEVILDCSDREKEAPRSLVERGCVNSQVEEGQSEAPPSLLSFAISSEGAEQREGNQHLERDHRPLKHRARHARLRRSESLSEKQVKEAKSKCKSIALLLTAAPNPNSKGVLMFKKRRQRARKYTLVSYGTGELERDEDEGEEGEGEEGDKENTFEVSLLATSESEIDEDFFSDIDNNDKIVTFDWDSSLLEVEKKIKSGDEMQTLPESTGKGALMFAKRRQRMDQITAEQEEMKARTVHTEERREAISENFQKLNSTVYQTKEEEMSTQQTCMSKSYTDMSQNRSKMLQQNGFGLAPDTNLSFQSSDAQRAASLNKTAKPFPSGVQNRAAAPFSPIRNITSPLSDIQAPPPYCSVSPPPEALYRPVSVPVASRAAPSVWSSSEPTEHIASRDERIAVPAKRTGILQEAKRRSTSKPMFNFKEAPKVSPNPALLSLVHNAEGKKTTGAGFESGPEEDYLSLGAEACNFMQTQASKQKAPPPVAPKPSVKISPTAGTPVWSPPAVASSRAPSFPAPASPQAIYPAPLKSPQHPHSPAHPPGTLNLAGPFKGPQATLVSPNHTPKTTTPVTPSAEERKPPFEMPPAMSGKGAQLFARRHSRMEKYVVDSETVQANMARASSPTPSLPASWKYSSNVRAPPPVAYNPIHSPSYPPGATKPSSKSTAATKTTKRKPKKGLNALDIMKHQPYQLDASLFTFQPPSTKESLATKETSKLSTSKQALPLGPASAGSPTSARASSVYSVPAYISQPSFQSDAPTPVNESYAPTSYSAFSKPESTTSSLFTAPRPKFSAKKAGVTAQVSGRSLSLPGRPSSFISQAMSPTSPLTFQPAPDYFSKTDTVADRTGKRPTPWEAASRSPLGLVDEAFGPQNMQESIAANVVSAARRKTLPEQQDEWKQKVSYEPPVTSGSVALLGGKQTSIISPSRSSLSTSSVTTQVGSHLQYAYCSQQSRTDPDIMSMDSRSDYCLSTADSHYNPQPRGWRRPT